MGKTNYATRRTAACPESGNADCSPVPAGACGRGVVWWSPASPVGSETPVARPAESSRCQTAEGSYGHGFSDAEVAIAGIGLISGAACLAATTICFSEQCLSFKSVVTCWNKTLR